jgi:hypothetical protein
MASGQNSAAVAAVKVKGVLSGKWIERAEVGAPGEFETMTDDETRARAYGAPCAPWPYGRGRDAALSCRAGRQAHKWPIG